ncbi:MAG: InlB B-repeat-containing protein, partial [Lachnospiraceae bacterium]|nr:InlB B-repeat-containing protein [Lachnospiraceae bacterium]
MLSLTPPAGYVVGTVSYNDGSDHTITPDASGNYSFSMPGTAADISVSATWLKPIADEDVSAPNVTATYDGAAHGIVVNVTGPASGATIKYGNTEGTYNLDASPTITNVSESPKTVYFKVAAENYADYTGSATITITPKSVVVSGIKANNKDYDGNKTATLNYSDVKFNGETISGLTVTATGEFEDANAGTDKTVNISDLTLGGTSASNYILAENGQQDTATADITKAAISPEISINGWTYGQKANTPSVTGNSGNGLISYSYKVKDAADSTYSKDVPLNAGNYTARAHISETEYYLSGTAERNFTIAKAGSLVKTADRVEVQTGAQTINVNLKGYLGDRITSVTHTESDGITIVDLTLTDPVLTFSINFTEVSEAEKSIVLTVISDNYDQCVLTIPIDVKAKTAEVKLDESSGEPTAIQHVSSGNLDDLAGDQSEVSVKIELLVQTKAESDVPADITNEIRNAFAGVSDSDVGKEYLDMAVRKTTGESVTTIEDTQRVLEIAVDYNLTGKHNPVILREHRGVVERFTLLETKPTNGFVDGTFFVDWTNNRIYIYTEKFSVYSIAYTTVQSYTVSFDAKGGKEASAIVVHAGGTIPAASIPTSSRSGYTFLGWFTEVTGGTKLTTSTVITADITYYAQWKQNSSGGGGGGSNPPAPGPGPEPEYCSVSFNMLDHGDSVSSQKVLKGECAERPADPVAEGFVFGGWYTSAECKEEELFDFNTPVNEDITLYAKWTERAGQTVYTVSFSMMDHGDPIDPVEVISGNKVIKPADPVDADYDFGGWYTSAECKEGEAFDFDTPIKGDITLYAKWTKKETVEPVAERSALDPVPEITEATTDVYLVKGQKFTIG